MARSDRQSHSLTTRAFLLMFAKGTAYILGFALPLLLVRRLNQYEFGLYKQVFLIVSTALTVLPLGFSLSAYYFLPREDDERKSSIVFNVLCFNLFVGGLAFALLVLRPTLLGSLFRSAELTAYAPLVGLVILLWMTSLFLEIAAIASEEAKLATLFIIASQLTKTTFLLAAALKFGTIRALLYAALVQGALQSVILVAYLRSRFPRFWQKLNWAMMRAQLSYALPIGLAGLVFGVLIDMHNYIVSYRFGAAAFAIYAVGCFSLPLVNVVGESFGTLLIPHISRLQKQGETRQIILVTAQTMRKLAAVYFPLYAFLIVTGREFLIVLFTEQYLASWPIFVIHLTTIPFFVLITDPIMRAYAEHRFFLLKVRAVTVVLLFFALWYGTLYFGLVGAIFTMVAFSLADRFIETAKAWRIVGVRWSDAALLKDVGKVAIAALASGAITAVARIFAAGQRPFVVLVACGIVFTCSYVAIVWLLRIPSLEERDALRSKMATLRRVIGGKSVLEPST